MTGQPTAAAEVLAAHRLIEPGYEVGPGMEWCSCGLVGEGHNRHQADMLDDAGLLATPKHDTQVEARALRHVAAAGRVFLGAESLSELAWNYVDIYADRIADGEEL